MKQRMTWCILAAVFALAACTKTPQPAAESATNSDSTQAAVVATIDAFHDALRSNDPNTPHNYVADDVVMMPPGEAAVRGKDAMRTWYDGFLGQYHTVSLKFDNRETLVGGDWATEWGTFEWVLKPVAGGADVVDRGSYAQVWKRQPDGQWKFWREIWNGGAPAEATATNQASAIH